MSSPNGGGFWMPPQASTVAAEVDSLFDFILYLNYFFFALITVLAIYFAMKYRRRRADQEAAGQLDHSMKLEWTWTVIPSLFLFVLFVWGFRLFLDMSTPPADALEVRVIAKKWDWRFEYANGAKTYGELIVPEKQAVKLVMASEDVLHSFFVPDFRVKQDVVPGRYTTLWFEALAPGTHQVFCTEYCGTKHSGMLATVTVLPPDEFKKRYDSGFEDPNAPKDPVAAGQQLFTQRGCMACHSVDGTKGVGPTLKGIWDAEEKMADGSSVKVDDNYIRESLMDPNAKLVAGFGPVMPSFKGQLDDQQVNDLIAFIKSLK